MKQWTVGKRILAGFGSLTLFLVIVLGVAITSMYRARNVVSVVDDAYLPVSELAVEIERNLLTARIHFVYLLTTQKQGSDELGLQGIASADEAYHALRQRVDADDHLQELRPTVHALEAKLDNYKAIAEDVIRSQKSGNWNDEIQAGYVAKWAPIGNELTKAAADIGRQTVASSRTSSRNSADMLNQASISLVIMAVIAVIIAGALSYWTSRAIVKRLRETASALTLGSGQLNAAAGQLSEASQILSSGSSEQAAALEETSATAEEINSMASRNMENAREAATLSRNSQQRFLEAGSSLENLVSAMNNITDQGQRVSKIVKTIDEIAFQTNILALNAAVEAARAGTAGLGFAVVADEVRTLAQRSAQAAKDTATLISETISRSDEGKQKTDVMVQLFAAIAEEEKRIKELIEEVNLGSQEQSRGLEQVAKAIMQIEGVTQRNAAAAEESASASEELAAQSVTMDNVVHDLESMVGK